MSAELLWELLKEKQGNSENAATRRRASNQELTDSESEEANHFYEIGHAEGYACGIGTAANLIEKYLMKDKQ